ALRVDQPVACGIRRRPEAELQSRLEGALEPRSEEGGVDGRRLVAHEHAHRDRRSRRVEPAPQHVAAWVDDLHLVAAGRPLHALDGLRVNPRMTGPYGLNVTGLETNRSHEACYPSLHHPSPPWRGRRRLRAVREPRATAHIKGVRIAREMGARAWHLG